MHIKCLFHSGPPIVAEYALWQDNSNPTPAQEPKTGRLLLRLHLISSVVQIVSDLKTLRTLAEYLLILDPVTFLGYLENLRAAESINSIWLFHDAAHTIFEQVRYPLSSLGLACDCL